MLDVAIVGVSHWHRDLYLGPLLADPRVRISVVVDPDPRIANEIAEKAGCVASTSWEELCGRRRPDFAFVLGRHCDMAEATVGLLQVGVPLVTEKPCALSSGELRSVIDEAERKGAFVAVPFVLRASRLVETLRRLLDSEGLENLSFKWIGSPTEKYHDVGAPWMLDQKLAGGGCLLNLGIHYLDLLRKLIGSDLRCDHAIITKEADVSVETYAAVTFRTSLTTALVETGYLFPRRPGVYAFDLHYSVRTSRHYVVCADPNEFQLIGLDGTTETIKGATSNVGLYPTFVKDVLDRFQAGKQPQADLKDMWRAFDLVEAAYAKADCSDRSDAPSAVGTARR